MAGWTRADWSFGDLTPLALGASVYSPGVTEPLHAHHAERISQSPGELPRAHGAIGEAAGTILGHARLSRQVQFLRRGRRLGFLEQCRAEQRGIVALALRDA